MKYAIFGAGIAGLAAAHELAELGHEVTVYESTGEVGGFFRSARLPEHDGMPSEYSWHGFGPWYHNAFAVMRAIPYDAYGSVYDRMLSRPMNFGIAPSEPASSSEVFDGSKMYRMSPLDRVGRAWVVLKAALAGRRSEVEYAAVRGDRAFAPYMSERALLAWRSTFGPWIGSDWTRVSLHTVGRFFARNLFPGGEHWHPWDDQGIAWVHGAGAEWLLLRAPSSEAWFEPWVRHLESKGVRFVYRASLESLATFGGRVVSAHLSTGEAVEADGYVLATNPFEALRISEESEDVPEATGNRLPGLVRSGEHVQISFRIAFRETVRWPRARAAFIVGDSPWNLTLFAQEQAWLPGESIGEGVGSLWTGTACACTVPGLFGVPATDCTRQGFEEDVLAQLRECGALDSILREANDGHGFEDLTIVRFEVWHEWEFHPQGVRGSQPKWVNDTTRQPHLPSQRTGLQNLALAGAHTRTDADLWSIEGAVESGRRAAKIFDHRVPVIDQPTPWWIRAARVVDDRLYALGLPHLIEVAGLSLVFVIAALVAWSVRGGR